MCLNKRQFTTHGVTLRQAGLKHRFFLFLLSSLFPIQAYSSLNCSTRVLEEEGSTWANAAYGSAYYWVVVEGYSSGSMYSGALRERGIPVIHVRAGKDRPAFYWGFQQNSYDRSFVARGPESVQRIAKILDALPVQAVVIGTDRGVAFGDSLASELGVWGNDPKTSYLRRDKFEMGEKMGDVAQRKVSTFPELVAFAREINRWPIVVKLPQGVGAFGFRVVRNIEQLHQAFSSMIRGNDNIGNPIDHLLVQEFLPGDVIAVDAVSLSNTHYITEVLKYRLSYVFHHNRESVIYDWVDVVNPADTLVAPAVEYALSAFERLGMRNGASHTEIMDTGVQAGSKRFRLIELNPRIIGAGMPALVKASTGESPIDIHIDSILHPQLFAKKRAGKVYSQWKPARAVVLRSRETGKIKEVRHLDEIQKLPSYISHRMKTSGHVQETVDLQTAPGLVFLSHPDAEQIERDTAVIRRFEAEDLYVLHTRVPDALPAMVIER